MSSETTRMFARPSLLHPGVLEVSSKRRSKPVPIRNYLRSRIVNVTFVAYNTRPGLDEVPYSCQGERIMILVTGANGTIGRAVLAEVARSGVGHRAMYRSKGEAAKAPVGTEAVVADFSDRTSLTAAMQGVESVYLVCSPIPQLVQLEGNAIEASEAAGVKRVVLNSALGAGDYAKSFPSWHRRVEDKLKASGLHYTILRPNSFMQN